MSRVNLYTNPSFADGLANTVALGGATLSITTDYSFYGPNALLIEKDEQLNSGFSAATPIPVTEGLSYGVGLYVRLPVTLPTQEAAYLSLQVQWLDSSDGVLSTSSSATYTLDDDSTWVRMSGVWVAPAGAVKALVRLVQPTLGTAGSQIIVDAILFEQASYVAGYFDNITQAEENRTVNTALTPAIPQVFNGMTLAADIDINGLILNTIDEDGTIWVCTDLEGWWGQAAPVLPDIPRGTEDGSYDVSGRYNSRFITLRGVFFPANTGEALSAARDKLISATNLVRQGGWLKAHENPTKAAFVRLSGQPQIETINARGRTEFSIGLKAADPIKYEWCSKCPNGLKHTVITGATGTGTPLNIGTADVTGIFEITGPLGAGSTIYNALTDETMTIVSALRGAGPVNNIISASVFNNVATIETETNHHLLVGDEILIAGAGSPYDSVDTFYTVTGVSQVFPYTVSFSLVSDDIAEESISGQVLLRNNDVLTVNTYDKSVKYNNSDDVSNRNKLSVLTDWIKFAPGTNLVSFTDSIDELTVTHKELTDNQVTLTTEDTHYLILGEDLVVQLAETVTLSKKSLTSNTVTLTTSEPHKFSVGDLIDVESVEISIVDQKEASTTEATIRTTEANGISVSDTVLVSLPVSAVPTTKSLTSNVATITTQNAHGYSAGDSVTVALPATATITAKALSAGQATLTTSVAHGYQINDSITVTLPTTASVVGKSRSGALRTLTTQTAHNFSVGDVIIVSLPETATLTDSRSIVGADSGYLVTLNTSVAHNFSVGDVLTVDVGITSTLSITNRESSGTTRTLTVGSHGFSVGERITVSGVSVDYNGTFYISAVGATTVSYVGGSSLTESLTSSSGSVVNQTIAVSYNGSGKVIETIPSETSFTYLAYDQVEATTSSVAGSSATLTNTTNQAFNGTKTLVTASGTQLAYNA